MLLAPCHDGDDEGDYDTEEVQDARKLAASNGWPPMTVL